MFHRPFRVALAIALVWTAAATTFALGGAPSLPFEASEATLSGATVPIELADCVYVETGVKVLPERTRPVVPAPFQIRLHPADGSSLVIMGVADCATATSGASSGTATFGWTSIALAPPADAGLRGDGVGFWLYRLEHFVVDGDVYRDVVDAVGAERVVASLDAKLAPVGSSFSIEWGSNAHSGGVVVSPTLPGSGPFRGEGVHWREYGSVPGGFAILDATLVGNDGSNDLPGEIRAAPGTAAEQILGPANVGLGTYGPEFSIEDGFMEFIPWP